MKKVIVTLVSILFFAFSGGFCELPIKFNGIGAGGEIGMVIPEDDAVENDGAAFAFGLKGMVEFSLGRFGTVQYIPSMIFWFKRDEWKDGGIEHEERINQIFLNFLDIKYLFPIPEKYFIMPYVGLTPIIPFIAIYRYDHDRDPGNDDYDSDADPCLNIFAGVDFPVTKIFRPYAEWRFSLTNEWAMKLSGGVTIHF
jgi:hypothetical protein